MDKDEGTNQSKNNFMGRQLEREIRAAKKFGKAGVSILGWWLIIILTFMGLGFLFSNTGQWPINIFGLILCGGAYYIWYRNKSKK